VRAEDHQDLRELLGAYVLDQLSASDRSAVADHLTTCPACRAEVAELEPVVSALLLLDPTASGDAAPPPDLGARVLQMVDAHRRTAARHSRLRRGAGAVLVAASVLAAFGFGSWFGGPRNAPPVIDVALNLDVPGLTADAGLVRHTWGTELKLEASGLTDGASYTVTFVRDNGSRVGAGSFLGTGAKPVRCSVNAALPLDAASELVITAADGTVVMNADLP